MRARCSRGGGGRRGTGESERRHIGKWRVCVGGWFLGAERGG